MFKVLDDLVSANPTANGLAIIVANEGSCRPDHSPLSGTVNDLYAITKAFESLRFATLPLRNASGQQIIEVVQTTSVCLYPESYKRLAFVFSGHGEEGCIYSHDMEIKLWECIFDPWMPKRAPHLAGIPKLFFFDACRGSGVDPSVRVMQYYDSNGPGPKGTATIGNYLNGPLSKGIRIATIGNYLNGPLSKGIRIASIGNYLNGPVPKGTRIASTGNYLLAYSTTPIMQAFEQPAAGGYWMQHLARELQNNGNIECSLIDIVTKVNRSVLEEMERHHCQFIQKPILESALYEAIYPLKEARHGDPILGYGISSPFSGLVSSRTTGLGSVQQQLSTRDASFPLSNSYTDHDKSQGTLGTNDLKNILKTAWNARTKWYNIGLELNIDCETLDTIEVDKKCTDDRFRVMLTTWLKIVQPKPTLAVLAAALRSPTVGCEHLAEQILLNKLT